MIHALCLSFTFVLSSPGVIDAEEWAVPVFRSVAVHLSNSTLYVFDGSEGKIKSYDIRGSWGAPKHIWSTEGFGQGPGEFPHKVRINNLTTDPVGKKLWVSHANGISIFDTKDGAHVQDIRSTFLHSWIWVGTDYLYMTATDSVFDRTLLRRWKIENLLQSRDFDSSPSWRVEHPTQVPVNHDGAALEEHNEVFIAGDKIFVFDFSFGKLAQISSDGLILNYKEISPWKWSEDFEADDYLPSAHFKKHLTMRQTYPISGYAFDNSNIWLTAYGPKPFKELTLVDGRKVPMTEKVLIKFNEKGDVIGYFRHPSLNINLTWHQLIGVHNGSLLFFSVRDDNKFFQIPIKNLTKIGA